MNRGRVGPSCPSPPASYSDPAPQTPSSAPTPTPTPTRGGAERGGAGAISIPSAAGSAFAAALSRTDARSSPGREETGTKREKTTPNIASIVLPRPDASDDGATMFFLSSGAGVTLPWFWPCPCPAQEPATPPIPAPTPDPPPHTRSTRDRTR
ncbi:hypothetical protein B0H12DRAFT_1112643 [Mycena haematopus]|nr:hypothetical protein B0H12DRAFT_1112643 [Mycena haematopus]